MPLSRVCQDVPKKLYTEISYLAVLDFPPANTRYLAHFKVYDARAPRNCARYHGCQGAH